jgi:hypothetical protein
VFFIPIVTASAVGSKHCRLEFKSFLDREKALGRNNLIFPLLYVRVSALEHEEEWRRDEVLEIIGARQYIDWQEYRHRDLKEPEIARKIELYCRNIVETLRRPWLSPEERQAREAEARRAAEDAEWRAQEDRRRWADTDARRKEEEDRHAREAERQRQAIEAERLAREQERRRRAENGNRATLPPLPLHPERGDEPYSVGTKRHARWGRLGAAESAGQYYAAAFVLVPGALSLAIAAQLVWSMLTRKSSELPFGVAFLLLCLAGLWVGIAILQAKHWSRSIAIAINLVVMLFAGLVATVAFHDSPPQGMRQILFLTAGAYASFVCVSLAGCVCFWLLWWKPDFWLNSRIPKSVGVFTIFVLINDALAFGFLSSLLLYVEFLANAGPWLGIFFIPAVSAYCVAAFYSRFGAAAKPPRVA